MAIREHILLHVKFSHLNGIIIINSLTRNRRNRLTSQHTNCQVDERQNKIKIKRKTKGRGGNMEKENGIVEREGKGKGLKTWLFSVQFYTKVQF